MYVYGDLCHGIIPMEVGDRDGFVAGQLIMAAICVPVALIYLLIF